MKRFVFFLAGLLLVCQMDAATINKSKKAKEVVWVIDAGHGGDDYGCMVQNYNEKTIALKVAKEVARLVKANISGVNVVLTREEDKKPTLKERCNIANKKDAELFISIHVNAAKNAIAYGTETYYATNVPLKGAQTGKSELLALLIQRQYLAHGRTAHDHKCRGVRQSNFYVIKHTDMPAVLTEIGFITNFKERTFITSEAGQKEIAQNICEALKEWKELTKSGIVSKRTLNNLRYSAIKPATKSKKTVEPVRIEDDTPIANEPEDEEDTDIVTDSKDVIKTDSIKEGVVQEDSLYFAIQLMSLSRPIPENDASLKGLKGVRCLPYEGRYILIYGHSDKYADIRKEQEEVKKEKDFSGAFIVAFRNGEKLSREDFGKLVDNGTDVKSQQAKPQAKTQTKTKVNNKSKAKKSR